MKPIRPIAYSIQAPITYMLENLVWQSKYTANILYRIDRAYTLVRNLREIIEKN
jgi:hypothetical protein